MMFFFVSKSFSLILVGASIYRMVAETEISLYAKKTKSIALKLMNENSILKRIFFLN